jgi:hypothetical protein
MGYPVKRGSAVAAAEGVFATMPFDSTVPGK